MNLEDIPPSLYQVINSLSSSEKLPSLSYVGFYFLFVQGFISLGSLTVLLDYTIFVIIIINSNWIQEFGYQMFNNTVTRNTQLSVKMHRYIVFMQLINFILILFLDLLQPHTIVITCCVLTNKWQHILLIEQKRYSIALPLSTT